MEKKWTQGLLRYERTGETPNKLDVLISAGDIFNQTWVAWAYKDADACLFSTAPELYDALEDCEYWLSAPPTSQSDRECVANVIKRARAVMAKANALSIVIVFINISPLTTLYTFLNKIKLFF